jgi:aldehyde:ferredoxin oxidoreductase
VRGGRKVKAANPEKLREHARDVLKLFKTSRTRQVAHAAPPWVQNKIICYGCTTGCFKAWFEAQGKKGKFQCQSSVTYLLQALNYYRGTETNPIEVAFLANKLCDEYGLDTMFIQPMLIWMQLCNQAGILTDENTGMPLSKMGSFEFIEVMLRKIALREGFGDALAQGIFRASDLVGSGARALITDYVCNEAGHFNLYDPRIYITTGLLYAMEPRQPIQQLHDVSWPVLYWLRWVDRWEDAFLSSEAIRALAKSIWRSELAVDFSTYEGKALAAKKIQDYTYAKESLILCDALWPMIYAKYSDNGVGDLESKILSAVTGKEVDKEELYRIGERIFNLQRAILVKERRQGRESDKLLDFYYTMPLPAISAGIRFNPECLVPGNGGLVISRKGEAVNMERFEKMKDEYYQLRGWDVASGLQTKAKLKELGLKDIMEGLARRELIV